MWPHSFRVSYNKDAIKKQFSDAFSSRDFQIVLAFFFGMFVSILAFMAASHHL